MIKLECRRTKADHPQRELCKIVLNISFSLYDISEIVLFCESLRLKISKSLAKVFTKDSLIDCPTLAYICGPGKENVPERK